MQNFRLGLAGLCILAMLLSMTVVQAAPQTANFAGTWELTMSGGRQGGGGGQGGGQAQGEGGEHRGGRGPQSLTITQDGEKLKVTHKTSRGEKSFDATVSGNTISWTEERPGRDGNTMQVQYKATLDTIKGNMGGGQYSREFTGKRTN